MALAKWNSQFSQIWPPKNWPKILGKWLFLAKFLGSKIGWNENFIMQMAYGDKKIFHKFYEFIIEILDFIIALGPE